MNQIKPEDLEQIGGGITGPNFPDPNGYPGGVPGQTPEEIERILEWLRQNQQIH